MIDLGTLVAKIQVDSGNSISDLQNFQKNVENAKNKSTGLKDTLKKLAAGFALGAAIKKTADAVVGCVKRADELKESINTLQTQTGATDEEMQGLGDSLKNIYADNYGESFDDIAVALAEVKNQTNLTGTELERTTENALALSDTFDFEIQESTRAADMMMKQFGVTSDEAFNLIAQGAQNGLDKNGNLLDSINEYSVHFKQLGFDAEDMFNMFSNGAKAGVFDVDKLGDAVKEFGIRCKDGSNTTIEAFESLGFNADELQQKFAQGGESAQDAFQEVVTALNNCDDEVVKNTAGVNLFGTMWEDMGADAVKALTDTNGEFDKTADNLNKIKEIKYDSLENAFEGIKRQIETGLVLPIGEKLLPKLNEFANYINDNMPDIKNTVESVMDGICSAISFVTDNLNIIIPILAAAVAGFTAFQIISTIAPLFTMIQTAIAGTTTVQAALNAVMVANPFGAVAVALAALVAAGVALYMNWDTIKTKCEELLAKVTEVWTNIKTAVFNKIEEIKDAINDKLSYFKNAGKNLFNALWDGLKEVWNNLKSWVSDKVDWIKDKLSVWKKAKDKMSGSDGSHRTGLQEVPFDGYRAILHKGEMVLTQPEAERYKKGNEGNRTENFNVYIGTVENKDERTTEDFMREMEFYRKRRVSAVGGAV